VSWLDINPAAVLHHVQAGRTTRADLAHEFGVLPSSPHLHDAIEALVADGELTERGEHLVPHDLLEPLTDNDLEDQ
jgi:hypothetical protein